MGNWKIENAKTDRKDGHVAFKASCRLVEGFFLRKVKLILL